MSGDVDDLHSVMLFVFVSSWMSLAGFSSHLFGLLMYFIICLTLDLCTLVFPSMSLFLSILPFHKNRTTHSNIVSSFVNSYYCTYDRIGDI